MSVINIIDNINTIYSNGFHVSTWSFKLITLTQAKLKTQNTIEIRKHNIVLTLAEPTYIEITKQHIIFTHQYPNL